MVWFTTAADKPTSVSSLLEQRLHNFVDCRKKIEEIGEKTSAPAMTQEEIISSTKTVVQGLETLRVEHHQVLNGLQASADNEKTGTSTTGLVDEKMSLLKKSIEMIELAMGEAQVPILYNLLIPVVGVWS